MGLGCLWRVFGVGRPLEGLWGWEASGGSLGFRGGPGLGRKGEMLNLYDEVISIPILHQWLP